MKANKLKAVIPILFVLAFLLQAFHRGEFRKIFLDAETQLAAAQNLKEGKGLKISHTNLEDLSKPALKPLFGYMPGYSFLLFIGLNMVSDGLSLIYFLDIVALAILFYSSFNSCSYLYESRDRKALLLLIGFLGFSLSPFHYLPATDLWALACWSLVGWSLLCYHRRVGEAPCIWAASIALIACVLLRYAYLPLALILPMTIAWKFFREKRNKFQIWELVSCLVLIIGIASILWFQASHSGKANYLAEMDESFFPEHLMHLQPFGLMSLVYFTPKHLNLLGSLHPLLFWLVQGGAFLITTFMLGWLIWLGRQDWRQSITYWALFALATGLLTLGLLAYMSVRVPAESWSGMEFWTYLMEPRYYAPILYGLLIVFPLILRRGIIPGVSQVFKFILPALMAFNILFWIAIRTPFVQKKFSIESAISQDLQAIELEIELADHEGSVALISKPLTRRLEWKGILSLPMTDLQSMDSLLSSETIKLYAYQSFSDKAMMQKLEQWGFEHQKSLKGGNLWYMEIRPTIIQ